MVPNFMKYQVVAVTGTDINTLDTMDIWVFIVAVGRKQSCKFHYHLTVQTMFQARKNN